MLIEQGIFKPEANTNDQEIDLIICHFLIS